MQPPPPTDPNAPDAGPGASDDPTTGDPTTPPPDNSQARAEALNDEGKTSFRSGDAQSAEDKFAEAASLFPDPRYNFNLCLAREALKKYKAALSACTAVEQSGVARLVSKAKARIKLINEKMN